MRDRAADPEPALIGEERLVVHDHVVNADDDRVLKDHRPASGKRIDLVLFVQRHRFGLQALFVVLMALLQFLELRRDLLHRKKGLELHGVERPKEQPDERRQDDEAPAQILDRLVDRQNDRRKEIDDRLQPRRRENQMHGWVPLWDGRLGAGTKSTPPGFHGWQRASRASASQAPRKAPWSLTATSAYCEHEG